VDALGVRVVKRPALAASRPEPTIRGESQHHSFGINDEAPIRSRWPE
jgi:hypothetical protein